MPDRVAVTVDVPSGRLACQARLDDGRPSRGSPVPERALVRDRPRRDCADVGVACSRSTSRSAARSTARWMCERSRARHRCRPTCRELIALQRELRPALERALEVVHPDEPDLAGIYGVIFWERLGPSRAAQRHGLRRRRGRSIAVRLRHVGPAGDPPRPRRDRRRRTLPPSIDRRFGLRCTRRRRGSDRSVGTRRSSPRSRARPIGPANALFTLDERDPLGTRIPAALTGYPRRGHRQAASPPRRRTS